MWLDVPHNWIVLLLLAAVACSIYVKVCWLLFPAQIARLLLGKAGNQLSQRFHLDSCYSWQDFTMSGEGPTDIKKPSSF